MSKRWAVRILGVLAVALVTSPLADSGAAQQAQSGTPLDHPRAPLSGAPSTDPPSPVTTLSPVPTGTVEGRVRLDLPAARRWASRYPTGGSATSRQHEVPVVVYLDGDLPAMPAGTAADILQAEGRFAPAAIAITAGTTVRFPNDDTFYHNVYSYSRPRFDLGRYPQGESREVVLDVPGLVEVYCEVHEFMRAVVVVTDHGFHAVVAADGTFRLTGVPAGRYTLVAFHPDVGVREAEVQVRDGAAARVDVEMIG